MKILGRAVFLLLLGGIWCQNNRNAKAGGRSTKKSGGSQGGDAVQSPPVADGTQTSTGNSGGAGSSRGTGGPGGTAETGREGAAGARAAGQQTDDMRLHFLKNTQVTCNDGTAAGWDVLHVKFSLAHNELFAKFFFWVCAFTAERQYDGESHPCLFVVL